MLRSQQLTARPLCCVAWRRCSRCVVRCSRCVVRCSRCVVRCSVNMMPCRPLLRCSMHLPESAYRRITAVPSRALCCSTRSCLSLCSCYCAKKSCVYVTTTYPLWTLSPRHACGPSHPPSYVSQSNDHHPKHVHNIQCRELIIRMYRESSYVTVWIAPIYCTMSFRIVTLYERDTYIYIVGGGVEAISCIALRF